MSLLRRRRVPWYAHLFMVIAVIYGFVQSEKLAPMITRVMDLEWWFDKINILRRRFGSSF
ncbi:MAG: hypothetical protein V2A56_05315 [bacterium]